MNILRRIVEYIWNEAPEKEKPSKDKIVIFLLGEKIEEEFWDTKFYYDLLKDNEDKKNKFLLPIKSLIKLTQSSDWSDMRLSKCLMCNKEIATQIMKSLKQKLYSDDELCLSNKRDSAVEDLLKRLLYKHFFGTDNLNGLFWSEKIVISPNYVAWESKENELEEALKEHHLVFLTGEPSNGKSKLLKHYLYRKFKKSNGYLDFTWLICDDSSIELSKYIVKLNFLNKKENREGPLEEVINPLKKKVNAYIVIYRPILSDIDFEFIQKTFKQFKMKTLIITRKQVQEGEYGIVYIGKWPQEKLKKISENWLKRANKNPDKEYASDITEDEYQEWFDEIEYNPYLVELICKSIKRSNEKSFKSIKISDFASKKGHSQNIHTEYRRKNPNGSSYPLKTLLTRILEPYSDEMITEKLTELSLWTYCVTSKDILIQIGDISEKEITDAMEYSFLVTVSEEKNLVKMPRILAEAIWRKVPIKYEKYKEIIGKSFFTIQSIEEMPDNFSYITLYDTWQYMIERIHKDMITIRSENKNIQKKNFEDWTEILELIKEYAESLGNTEMLFKINNILYMRYSKNAPIINSSPEQSLKKEITEMKRIYIKEGDMKKTIEQAELILNNFLQSPQRKFQSIEISFIILDTLQWFVDQNVKSFVYNLFDHLVKKKKPSSRYNVLAVLTNYITQIQKYGTQNPIQYNGKYYTTNNNYKILYYQMLYYIDSIAGKEKSLYVARGLYHKFMGYVDLEWRIKGLLQSQLFEEIYIIYNVRGDEKKTHNFNIEFEHIEAIIIKKSWPKDIMELYYLAGILYYLFIEKGEDKKLKNFLLKMKETHIQQFTMSQKDISKFLENYEKLKEESFSPSFEKKLKKE